MEPTAGLHEQKQQVRDFWDEAACGEVYALGDDMRAQLAAQARTRYALEPFIADFARFTEATDRDVLEIGVGMGADHLEWARAQPRMLAGVDLTPRAAYFTTERLRLEGLPSCVSLADAHGLPFADDSFDIVYSWGVLHHSPDTPRSVREVHRVLRQGGRACVMVYQRHSLLGWMLWLRYALLGGRPLRPLGDIYAQHLESPGTQAFSAAEVSRMFADFARVEVSARLSPGDLITGEAGQRHRGLLLSTARRLWPRALIRRWLERRGLFLIITAVK